MKELVLHNAAVQVVAIAVAVFVVLGFIDSIVNSYQVETDRAIASITSSSK
jgi:hypothetical protein